MTDGERLLLESNQRTQDLLVELINLVRSLTWNCGCGQVNVVSSLHCLICGRNAREDQKL